MDSVRARDTKFASGLPRLLSWLLLLGASGCSDSVTEAMDGLDASDSTVRYAAAKTLEDLAPEAEAAIPALADALGDDDRDVRYRAAKALSKVPGDLKPAVAALASALRDEQRNVRYYAAKALACADEDAAAVISDLSAALETESDAKVRYYLVKVLRNVAAQAGTARPVLERALSDPDERVRQMAAATLQKMRG
jgi:HEAT repeat protein